MEIKEDEVLRHPEICLALSKINESEEELMGGDRRVLGQPL